MNKSFFFLCGIALAALLYLNISSQNNQTAPILFKTKNNASYAAVKIDSKAKIVDNYLARSPKCDKELILDSTYTYTLKVHTPTEVLLLEGTWELSYKNEEQHLILNSTTDKQQAAEEKNYFFEERKFALTTEGIKDLLGKEEFVRQNIIDRSLAVYE